MAGFEIPNRIVGQEELSRILPYITPRMDMTYRTIADVSIEALDLTQSILTGSLWRNIEASALTLRRSDLDGMRFEACTFCDVDFAYADIRSTSFVRCSFEQCCFDHALIDDCTFESCTLRSSTFRHTVQRGNAFRNSTLADYSISESSFTMTRLEGCHLQNLRLADCTFLYIVARDCEFEGCTINIESIGTVYGLDSSMLANTDLVFLGQDAIPTSTDDLGSLLLRLFEERRWHLATAVTQINLRRTSVAYSMLNYLRSVRASYDADRPQKREELTFVSMMMDALDQDSRLPLIVPIQAARLAHELREQIISSERSQAAAESQHADALAVFGGRATHRVHDQIEKFERSCLAVDSLTADTDVTLRIVFRRRPSVEMPALLRETARAAGFTAARDPIRLDARSGSYLEIVGTTLLTAYAFQILLFILNGVVIQMTELRARSTAIRQKKLPSHFRGLARTGSQRVPAVIRRPLERLLPFVLRSAFLDVPDLAGLDTENIESLELQSKSDEDLSK